MAKERIKAIANLIVEVLVLVNMVLTAMGKSPIPFDDQKTLEVLSYMLAGLQTLRVWWLNQNMTVEAETAQKMLDDMKKSRLLMGGEGDPLGDDRE